METALLIDHNIDMEHKTIYLTGEVNDKMFNTLAKGMALLVYADYITIVLNTDGGDFYQALAMYDMMKFSEVEIKVVCVGTVMSAGVIILNGGTERIALPNTQFMVHYGSDVSESPQDAKQNMEMLKLMQSIVAKRATKHKRTVNSWFANDTYFSADKALEVGLIDKVTTHGKRA